VTEAAQSRLTAISGARDDFLPEKYEERLKPDLRIFRDARKGTRKPTLGQHEGKPGDHLAFILERLNSRGIRSAVVVPLGGEQMGFSVAKIVVPDLEDPPESRHRRFGRRGLNAMLGAGLDRPPPCG
jgi:ribosomal protein S12 methylthiotransferase accessory factor